MIYVTERAKQELKKLLANSVDWPGARLRLMDRGQGRLGLGIDVQSPDDITIDYEGVILLVIEPRLAESLRQITLDVDDTPEGVELVIVEEVVRQSTITGTESWVPLVPASYSKN